MVLTTPEQRASFRENGYLVIRDFFSAGLVNLIRETADELGGRAERLLEIADKSGVPHGELTRTFGGLVVVPERDDPTKVCRFEHILGTVPTFNGFVRGVVTPVISELLGEKYIPFKDKENEKRPGGGAFPPHQDFAAYQIFGPRYNVTAMLTIDPATIQNGCLHMAANYGELSKGGENISKVVGGRALFHYHEGGPNNGDIRDAVQERINWKPVETSPADLVVFDSFVPHYSQANGSEASRRAMFLTHSAQREGDWYDPYYQMKIHDPSNPAFHVSTPTAHSTVEES